MSGWTRRRDVQVVTYYLPETNVAVDGVPIFVAPKAGHVVDVRAVSATAPTGTTEIYDVNKNGTTIFTTQANRPTIADGGTVSTTVGPDVTAFVKGDIFSIDTDAEGGTTEGLQSLVQLTVALERL